MEQGNEPYEEFSFRFWKWELKAKKPGKNSIAILVILSLLIICLTILNKYG